MINIQILQNIAADPPASKLALYSLLCEAHTYSYGDATLIGSPAFPGVSNVPNSVFVLSNKALDDNDAILATCYIGQTISGTTSYSPVLGFYSRAAEMATRLATALATIVLGKALGTHVAEAMGYSDYLVFRAIEHTITDVDGVSGKSRVMPLVIPPEVATLIDNHYLSGSTETATLIATIYSNPSHRLNTSISVDGLLARPPSWFYSTPGFSRVVLPVNTYLTDDQCWATVDDRINVMQQARIESIESNLDDAGNDIDTLEAGQDVLAAGHANVVSLVGSLSNSVKDVTDRYNAVTQYIPRS